MCVVSFGILLLL